MANPYQQQVFQRKLIYVALVVVTGPIGGVMVFARLQRTPRAVLVPQRSPQPDRGSTAPPPDPA